MNLRDDRTDLVIKSAFRFKIVKEAGIGLPSPELHIRNLKVTPDYEQRVRSTIVDQKVGGRDPHSGINCSFPRHRLIRIPMRCLLQCIPDAGPRNLENIVWTR